MATQTERQPKRKLVKLEDLERLIDCQSLVEMLAFSYEDIFDELLNEHFDGEDREEQIANFKREVVGPIIG